MHLLEDEFNEVRMSAIDIIGNFGRLSESFARESRDILFYMLNDENDAVRIRAVQTMTKVLASSAPSDSTTVASSSEKPPKLIDLRDEDIDNLMFNLKERVVRLRIVIYELLSIVRYSSMRQLQQVLDICLLNVINAFSDSSYIYAMCRSIGQNNSALVRHNICAIL